MRRTPQWQYVAVCLAPYAVMFLGLWLMNALGMAR